MKRTMKRTTFSRHMAASTDGRRGAAILIVMVCLLLASMLGASLVNLALAQRKQARRAQLHLQATWLAESGLERAAAQLARDPEYAGETWKLPENGPAGLVRIEVNKDEANTNRRVVRVVADYPRDTAHRARVSKQVLVEW